MSFSAITTGQIAAGEPISQDLLTKVKDNFDDHESRISGLASALAAFRPLTFHVTGEFYRAGVQSLLLFHRINFDCTLSAGRLVLLRPGSSGTLTVDVLLKRGAGAWNSIFTVKPSIVGPGSAYDVANGTLGTVALLNGDLLGLSIDSAMVGCKGFLAELDYTT